MASLNVLSRTVKPQRAKLKVESIQLSFVRFWKFESLIIRDETLDSGENGNFDQELRTVLTEAHWQATVGQYR